ncbi:MAG: hypothetical protein NTX91_00510 [candidate division SR1 bacterium]|nr:hypothetical protein [candidate division SR1 bacterium]
MTNIKLTYHKGTDISNRREACNRKTQSSTWKKAMTDEIYNAIRGKERKDASSIILEHIDKNYGTVDMEKYEMQLSLSLEKNKDVYIKKMETLTKQPFLYDEITCYLTTLARCPYNREKGLIRLWYKAQDPVRVFLHEILHFQFHQRYRDNPKVKLLSKEQFEDLKESLTFLLNIEFKEYIEFPDYGYPQHQELRKQLEDYRLSQPENERDFEKLIDYGCDLLSSGEK